MADPVSVPMLDPMTASEAEAEDLLYFIRGTGLDRDRKLSAKNLAEVAMLTSDLEILDSPNKYSGHVLGLARSSGFAPYEALMLPFPRIVEDGSSGLFEDVLDDQKKLLALDVASGKTRLLDGDYLTNHVKVVELDDTTTSYTVTAGTKHLILRLQGTAAKTINGTLPDGIFIQIFGLSNWGWFVDGYGRYSGSVTLTSLSTTIGPFRDFCNEYTVLSGNLAGLGEYPAMGSSAPSVYIDTIRKLEDITVKADSLTETYPSSTNNQSRTITFWAGVYHNLLKIAKGGIRIAHGLEIEQTSSPPTITDNDIGRLRQHTDRGLYWWRGKNGATDYGSTRIDNPTEMCVAMTDCDLENVGNGSVWAMPYINLAGTGSRVPFMASPAKTKPMSVGLVAVFTTAPAAASSLVFTVRLLHYTTSGGLVATIDTDVTLNGNGSGTVLGGAADISYVSFFAAGATVKLESVILKTKTAGIDTSAACCTVSITIARHAE